MGVEEAAVVAVLTRAPSAGGKSRLFADLGLPTDPELLTGLLLDTLDGALESGAPCVVSVDPPERCDEVRRLVSPGVRVVAQAGGDLGTRMRTAMSDLFRAGARAVALIGSDLPTIGPGPIRESFACLAENPEQLVLGPASDGGYYLIAAARPLNVFDRIEWGTARVFAQTVTAAARAGVLVHLVEPLSDIDSAADARALADSSSAPRTRAWFAKKGLFSLPSEGRPPN